MVVDSGGNLALHNLTIAYGRASGTSSGGGIINYGTLTITGCTFYANYSDNDAGGVLNYFGTLTITASTFASNYANGNGGGLYNYNGTLTVTDSAFSLNTANAGGGVVNSSGTLTITDSTFSQNTANFDGGGVHNNATLAIANSTFSGNSASAGGGGVWNSGTLTLTNSTFSQNTANAGGGVWNYTSLTLINSTFSGNSASGNGGGVYNFDATLAIINSTISGNSAGGSGGGVYNYLGDYMTLKNTIIANSTSGGDCVGMLSGSNINNLIESMGANACGLTNGSNGKLIGSDPNLGSLTGSPGYLPLNSGSPAIDAGDNPTCAAPPVYNQSQNGVIRPQDGDHDTTVVCDIGAYEVPAAVTAVFRSAGAKDGWILESSETSRVGATTDSAATTLRLGDDVADAQYRAILSFNTASLPDTAVITKVTLKIKREGQTGTNPFTILGALRVGIRSPFFGTSAALAASDFQAAATLNNIGSIPNTPVNNWYSRTWSSGAFFAEINRSGTTQFRLYFATDDNDDNGADYMRFFSGDHPTASARPKLIIEYYVP